MTTCVVVLQRLQWDVRVGSGTVGIAEDNAKWSSQTYQLLQSANLSALQSVIRPSVIGSSIHTLVLRRLKLKLA